MEKKLTLNHITKIEGHASLTLKIAGNKIEECKLNAIEGSRYFEGILEDRYYNEASEISARICGICSTSHTLAAIFAMENALKVKPTSQTLQLRRLLTIGERIRSHAAHLYFLALPDYLGYQSALQMASKFKKELKTALTLSKIGNQIVQMIGGRAIHPVSAAIGGFWKLPTEENLLYLEGLLKSIIPLADATFNLISKLEYPSLESKSESFCVSNKKTYGTFVGQIKSGDEQFKFKDYHKNIEEYTQFDSTSHFVSRKGASYRVGSLSRIANNYKFLSDKAKTFVRRSHLKKHLDNPFYNNIAQAIELRHHIDEGIKICQRLKIKDEGIKKYKPKSGRGVGAYEAPRGTLFHEYTLNSDGRIVYANIITPTCQNLRGIQDDIKLYLPNLLKFQKNKIVFEIEKLLRTYDPCFSCSTHFLEVNWK